MYSDLIKRFKSKIGAILEYNSLFDGDVYDNWTATHDVKYGSVNCTLLKINHTENYKSYNIRFYYGDRMLPDASNKHNIQERGCAVIISLLEASNCAYQRPIEFNLFEGFGDDIVGVWCDIEVVVLDDIGECNVLNIS